MVCEACDNAQPTGRFCGRCGARVAPPARRAPERPAPSRWRRPARRSIDVAVAVTAVLVVPVMVLTTGRTVDHVGSPGRMDPVTVPSADATAPEPVETHPAATTVDTVLLFDDGRDGAIEVDFDDGVLARHHLPGQRAGERPFRLWRLDRGLAVGSDAIWSVRVGSGSAHRLGDATTFLPGARPDHLWLIDDPGGPADDRPPTWTLVSDTGAVLHRAIGQLGMTPVRGVPGGLALATEHGLKVYDVHTRRIYFYVGAPHGWLGDVSRDRIVWCLPGCSRLVVAGADGERSTIGSDEILAFETGAAWLSTDGRRVAAVATTAAVGIGPVRQVLVFDIETGAVLARHRLPTSEVRGGWSIDGREFYLAVPEGGVLSLGRFRVGGTAFEVRRHPLPTTVRAFVALPRTATSG